MLYNRKHDALLSASAFWRRMVNDLHLLRRNNLVKATFAGVISGIVLGLFLKAIEQLTSLKVYTLLLNIDYIPLLNRMSLPEILEFTLHLIISILMSICLSIYLQSRHWSPGKNIYSVMIVSLIVAVILYSTTTLSERTPEITDIPALFVWLLGHAIYGWILGWLLRKQD